MIWIEPKNDTNQVNTAGRRLVDPDIEGNFYEEALEVLSNYRGAHAFPLNTIQQYLRKVSYIEDKDSLVAQRLKKLSSIVSKLNRFPKMRLSQMQDIGGCRAIVSNIVYINQIESIIKESRIRHILKNEKDYIKTPKESGYRGIHLIYQYMSDRNSTFNNLQIEIQLRTKLQHIWATTVETMGTFIDHSLKSSEGPGEWLRFFSLMSSIFAIEEQCMCVPNTSESKQILIKEIKSLCDKNQIISKLRAYKSIIKHIEKKGKLNDYILLYLNHNDSNVEIIHFNKSDIDIATKSYIKYEKDISEGKNNADVVLVSSDSIDNIKIAYPNYFLDTHEFTSRLEKILEG
jgi:ppGpp synthetase/RelA/SpoT-type nucleotidyltranferase